ncbi:MAG TPA: glycoside hydrolase family 3 N-terminal domain-containing protein, partial [Nitrospira sp.]|nr:glycoside hydrolase family 3 N-terminal domain-containing protein [Nitrospira sp.]
MCALIADRPSPVQFPSELTLVQAPPVSDIPSEFPSTPGIYRDGWVDLNKNNRKDVYEDPRAPIERRLDDLLSQMTTDEKTCQLATLYGWKAVLKDQLPTKEWKSKIWKDGIANIDEQLNSKWGGKDGSQYFWPPSRHAAALNEIQRFFVEQTRLGVPVDFTNEGIQGCASFAGTHFPIPTGMGATWDLDLIRREGEITGLENRLLGFTTVYAPILDVVRDQRWGRSEESFSEDPFLLTQMGVTTAKAIQAHGSASCAKHFAVYSFNKGAREGLSRTDPHVAPRM